MIINIFRHVGMAHTVIRRKACTVQRQYKEAIRTFSSVPISKWNKFDQGSRPGVVELPNGRWEATITIGSETFHIGTFNNDFEAASAYDEWKLMLGPQKRSTAPPVPRSRKVPVENDFSNADLSMIDFLPPSTDASLSLPIPHTAEYENKYLTLDEIMNGLEAVKGIDFRSIDLTGRSDIASHMVFVTGHSQAHMRKMGDMLVQVQKRRKLWKLKPQIEGRDCDDWMIVDCGPVIVHIFDPVGRKFYDLETHWKYVRDDKPHELYDGLNHDELCELFPVPDRDEIRNDLYLRENSLESVDEESIVVETDKNISINPNPNTISTQEDNDAEKISLNRDTVVETIPDETVQMERKRKHPFV